MNVSRPVVHPVVEAPPMHHTDENNAPRRVRMRDAHGMPGTFGGLVLRIGQMVFAAMAVSVMATTSDFPSVTAFCYLVAAAGLQSIWSLLLAIVDIYALLVGRCLHNRHAVRLFAIGDGITSTLTFAAACSSAGITVLIDNDLGLCRQNHCTQFETATAMAFLSWFVTLPSFFMNFWSLAS